MSEKLPIVYVTHHDPTKNLVRALRFGSVEEVLPWQDNPSPANIPSVTAKIQSALAGFTEDDYLCLMGSPIAIAICCAVAALRTKGRVKLLKYDQQERDYFVAVMNLTGR